MAHQAQANPGSTSTGTKVTIDFQNLRPGLDFKLPTYNWAGNNVETCLHMLAAAVNVTVSQVRKLTREGYSRFDERCLWHAAQSGRPILVAKLEEILDSMDYSDQSISTVINTCKTTAQTVVGVAYQLGDRILSTYPGTVRVLCGHFNIGISGIGNLSDGVIINQLFQDISGHCTYLMSLDPELIRQLENQENHYLDLFNQICDQLFNPRSRTHRRLPRHDHQPETRSSGRGYHNESHRSYGRSQGHSSRRAGSFQDQRAYDEYDDRQHEDAYHDNDGDYNNEYYGRSYYGAGHYRGRGWR